jgi:hypothetical protein
MQPLTDSIKWEQVTDKETFFSVVENMGRGQKVNEFVDWCLGDTGKCCNWWMNSALGIGLLAEFTVSSKKRWKVLAHVGSVDPTKSNDLKELRQTLKNGLRAFKESSTSWTPSKPFLKGPYPENAFADLVVKHGPKLCWGWRGDFDHEGRPVYKFQKAYRVSYALYRGPITGGEDIHHKCFNRQCVNPAHLQKLTKAEHKAKHRGHSDTPRTLSLGSTNL